MSPVTTILEPNPSRVRNIFICSGLVFCASSRMMKASLSVRPRMNASGAISIVAAVQVLVHPLRLEHVVERVEERAQVGVDLRHHVARQEAEPLAGLDGRAGEDDPAHLAPRQRGHGHGHREERLPGARRADAHRDRLVADRVDVALLIDRLRRHPQAAMAPHDVLEDPARALVAVERPADRLDRAGRDVVALADEVRHLAHHGLGGGHLPRAPVERQHVAAQVHVAVEVVLERLHDRVVGTSELGCHVVGELEPGAHYAVARLIRAGGAAGRSSGALSRNVALRVGCRGTGH